MPQPVDPYDHEDPNRIYRLNTDAQLPPERRPRPTRRRIIAVWALVLIVAAFIVTATHDPHPVAPAIQTLQDQPSPTGTHTPKPALSPARQNALRSAKAYLEYQGFSRRGLIRQLTSVHADHYTKADATYAADHAGADWNAEAVESARGYLELQGYSRTSLIRQLSSRYADQYTHAQAVQAADKVGL